MASRHSGVVTFAVGFPHTDIRLESGALAEHANCISKSATQSGK
jgi:hypothetical protein